MKRLIALLFCIFMLMPTAISAQSGYPEREDWHVNDYADLLASEDEDHLRQGLARFQTDNGIEITVLTIESVDDFDRGATIERFATNLFNQWAIGDSEYNDAILLLVASEDRTLRIEVGDGYGRTMDEPAQRIIDRDILPYFRDGDFASGIIAGANALMDEVVPLEDLQTNDAITSAPTPQSPTQYEPPSSYSDRTFGERIKSIFARFFPLFIAGALAPLLFGTFYYRKWNRLKQRDCPICGNKLHRLDEKQDDVYLTSGQQIEEILKSIDYDVWKCNVCNHHDVLPYKKWFSEYSDCPNCDHKTLASETITIQDATTYSTGLKEIIRDCEHCEFVDVETAVIPMISDSDSSSSSSFSSGGSSGGGSSSGGGASGSW